MPAAAEPKKLSALASLGFGGASAVATVNFTHPIETVKTRIQVLGASYSIAGHVRTEGVAKGLYKGLGANVGRASTLAAAELASYDAIKPLVRARLALDDGLLLHGSTALCSGFIAALVANPFDVVKSRVMRDAEGQYKGMVDCFAKTIGKEGPLALWKGFIPAWARVGPRVVIAFVVMEQLRLRFG